MPLTEVTRRALVEELVLSPLHWCGRLEEPEFLARLYNLKELPSTDQRFSNAEGDIYQHTVWNFDWEKDWVFSDPRFGLDEDENLFRFLVETVHPAVRPNRADALQLVEMYDQHLRPDGFELHQIGDISERPIYGIRQTSLVPSAVAHIERIVRLDDMEDVRRRIRRMDSNIETDPELAIGSAKEIVETICHLILDDHGVETSTSWDLPRLVKETSKVVRVTPQDVSDTSPSADTIRKVLGSLAGVVAGIEELRNAYGTGHGRSPGRSGLGPRHARLAVGAASTIATFLYETALARR